MFAPDAAEQIVGRERRGREVIADFQLPIVDLIRAAASTQPPCGHLRLNEKANEISTVHPAASFSSQLDRLCGSAPLLGQFCHFADAQ
jgi:hypothetical protein